MQDADLAGGDRELRRGALRPRPRGRRDRARPGAARRLAGPGARRGRGAGGARGGPARGDRRAGAGRGLGARRATSRTAVEALLAAKVGARAPRSTSPSTPRRPRRRRSPRARGPRSAPTRSARSSRPARSASPPARPRSCPESAGVIAAIADVLRGCPGAEFEIAGHTDGQGPAEVNRAAQRGRAPRRWSRRCEAEDLPLVALVGARLRRVAADRRQRDRPTAGRATGASSSTSARSPEPEPRARGRTAGRDAADCLAAVEAILAETTIEFEAGSAEIAEASAPAVAAIGAGARRLSRRRGRDRRPHRRAGLGVGQPPAERAARRGGARRAARPTTGPLPELVARGYGEAEPVADNDTEEGRAQNRRIAFTARRQPDERRRRAGGARRTGAVADCVARVGAILAESSIQFAPGSATIAGRERAGDRRDRARRCAAARTRRSRSAATPTRRGRTAATCGSASGAPRRCSPRCAPTTCRSPR